MKLLFTRSKIPMVRDRKENQSMKTLFTSPTRGFLRVLFSALALVMSAGSLAADFLVANQTEYLATVGKLAPGDTIILKDGIWRDFEIVFEGAGEPDRPITLRAETPGEVFITGQSNLALAGEHLLVSGLVFRDGYTPSQSVISFRKSKAALANNSRVTQTVIHNFTNPERFEADYWVAIYGKNNRFDHNHLEGKRNRA